MEELKSDHERAFGESERRRASELREVRERAELERQAWEENLLRKQEATLLARERELRETLRRERDKVWRVYSNLICYGPWFLAKF